MVKKLYEFNWYSNYSIIDATFVEDDEVIKKYIGKWLPLGEMDGEYSDVSDFINESNFKEIEAPSEFIEQFEKIIGSTGIGNPLNYIKEEIKYIAEEKGISFEEAELIYDEENKDNVV